MSDQQRLDVKGLRCPMPIVKIAKAMKEMVVGQTLEVVATDPVFRPDLEAWCRKTGQHLVSVSDKDGSTIAVLEKKV